MSSLRATMTIIAWVGTCLVRIAVARLMMRVVMMMIMVLVVMI